MVSLLDGPSSSIDDYVIRYWYKPEGPRHAAVRGAGNAGFTSVFYYECPAAAARPLQSLCEHRPWLQSGRPDHWPERRQRFLCGAARGQSKPCLPVNGLNQYTSAGPAAFQYDANGNLTSDGVTSYLYDVENRLVSASGAKTASLAYDPLGRLFQVSSPATGTTRFLYDDLTRPASTGRGSRASSGPTRSAIRTA